MGEYPALSDQDIEIIAAQRSLLAFSAIANVTSEKTNEQEKRFSWARLSRLF